MADVLKKSTCKRAGIRRLEQQTLTKYVLVIIKKKQWKRLTAAWAVKKQNV